ncbi:MAG: hypothetical protein Q7K34_00695 [archaeon]|nr:hypothetical protein [archaeon]
MSGQKIPVVQVILAALLIGLALFSGNPALYYPAIIFACFAMLKFFTAVAKPKKLSEKEFDELDKKYSGKVFAIDALSIILVLVETAAIYLVLAGVKENAYNSIANAAVFISNPQGLLFVAAFLFSLSTIGWLVWIAVKNIFGPEYWVYYYNRRGVGFDTKKIYGFISLGALLLAVPALVFGFMDYSLILDNGIHLGNWGRLSPVDYAWGDISEIQEFTNGKNTFYLIKFSNGDTWNTSNEKWNVEESLVIEFISSKAGKEIRNFGSLG